MARFCPEWIYSICCSQTAIEFLSGATLLESCAKKYSVGLSEHFENIPSEIISQTAHELLIFLAEIEAGETAVHMLNTYSYNRLKFEATKNDDEVDNGQYIVIPSLHPSPDIRGNDNFSPMP